jgi:hypothetical protein
MPADGMHVAMKYQTDFGTSNRQLYSSIHIYRFCTLSNNISREDEPVWTGPPIARKRGRVIEVDQCVNTAFLMQGLRELARGPTGFQMSPFGPEQNNAQSAARSAVCIRPDIA